MLKSTIIKAIDTHARQRQPLSDFIAKLARLYVRAHDNVGGTLATNGEKMLLQRLGGRLACVFDVGANVGDWSALALQTNAGAAVHAFEPIPATAAALRGRMGELVTVVEVGLFDSDGAMVADVPGPQQATLMPHYPFHPIGDAVPCQVMRGDRYCGEHGISHIDLLKIDCEGAEPNIINGFGDMVGNDIDVIQFEYGFANIYTSFHLRDYADRLGPDYFIGKLHPDGVAFNEPLIDDFALTNYVAVARRRSDLKNLLARP